MCSYIRTYVATFQVAGLVALSYVEYCYCFLIQLTAFVLYVKVRQFLSSVGIYNKDIMTVLYIGYMQTFLAVLLADRVSHVCTSFCHYERNLIQ